MKNFKSMSTGKVVLGVLAGVAAGATLGILFAPDKGATTRKKIYQKGDAYVEGLEDKFNEFIDGVTRKFDTVRKEANRMVENAKSKAEELATEASEAAQAKMPKQAA